MPMPPFCCAETSNGQMFVPVIPSSSSSHASAPASVWNDRKCVAAEKKRRRELVDERGCRVRREARLAFADDALVGVHADHEEGRHRTFPAEIDRLDPSQLHERASV